MTVLRVLCCMFVLVFLFSSHCKIMLSLRYYCCSNYTSQATKNPSPQRYPPVPPQTTAAIAKGTAAVRSPNKAITAAATAAAGNGTSSSDDAVAFQFNLGFAEDDLLLTITESDVSAVLRLGKIHIIYIYTLLKCVAIHIQVSVHQSASNT
jgi:hypothetical protein